MRRALKAEIKRAKCKENLNLINKFWRGINIINELHCLPHHIKMMKLRTLNSFMGPRAPLPRTRPRVKTFYDAAVGPAILERLAPSKTAFYAPIPGANEFL
jgi:hypothetical protein